MKAESSGRNGMKINKALLIVALFILSSFVGAMSLGVPTGNSSEPQAGSHVSNVGELLTGAVNSTNFDASTVDGAYLTFTTPEKTHYSFQDHAGYGKALQVERISGSPSGLIEMRYNFSASATARTTVEFDMNFVINKSYSNRSIMQFGWTTAGGNQFSVVLTLYAGGIWIDGIYQDRDSYVSIKTARYYNPGPGLTTIYQYKNFTYDGANHTQIGIPRHDYFHVIASMDVAHNSLAIMLFGNKTVLSHNFTNLLLTDVTPMSQNHLYIRPAGDGTTTNHQTVLVDSIYAYNSIKTETELLNLVPLDAWVPYTPYSTDFAIARSSDVDGQTYNNTKPLYDWFNLNGIRFGQSVWMVNGTGTYLASADYVPLNASWTNELIRQRDVFGNNLGVHAMAIDTYVNRTTVISMLASYEATFGAYPDFWFDHGSNRVNVVFNGLNSSSPYFIWDLMNSSGIKYVWANDATGYAVHGDILNNYYLDAQERDYNLIWRPNAPFYNYTNTDNGQTISAIARNKANLLTNPANYSTLHADELKAEHGLFIGFDHFENWMIVTATDTGFIYAIDANTLATHPTWKNYFTHFSNTHAMDNNGTWSVSPAWVDSFKQIFAYDFYSRNPNELYDRYSVWANISSSIAGTNLTVTNSGSVTFTNATIVINKPGYSAVRGNNYYIETKDNQTCIGDIAPGTVYFQLVKTVNLTGRPIVSTIAKINKEIYNNVTKQFTLIVCNPSANSSAISITNLSANLSAGEVFRVVSSDIDNPMNVSYTYADASTSWTATVDTHNHTLIVFTAVSLSISGRPIEAHVGHSWSFTAYASHSPVTWIVNAKPAWMTATAGSSSITFTGTPTQVSTPSLTVTVTYLSSSVSQTWTLLVLAGTTSGTPASNVVAKFTYTVSGGPTTNTITFIDQSTGSISQWAWNFGDGKGSHNQNPVHTYASKGTYTVTLVVMGMDNTVSQATKTIVMAQDNPLPNLDNGTAEFNIGSNEVVLDASFFVGLGIFWLILSYPAFKDVPVINIIDRRLRVVFAVLFILIGLWLNDWSFSGIFGL